MSDGAAQQASSYDQAADSKAGLLTTAAAEAAPVAAVGDMARFLAAYYRHVEMDDLDAAGAGRAANVALAHARLAASRPQGTALVQVSQGGGTALDGSSDVIDIVTDDMPFLVDSITMELANHGLASRLVVHPVLRVRRDVTGVLREVLGAVAEETPEAGSDDDARQHDELTESWTHIEIPTLGEGEPQRITADLRRVLGDVRVSVEDYARMRANVLWLAEDVLAPEADDGSADSPSEIAELLRWLVDGHFTFLGYREYDLASGPDGMALTAVPGTGLGILRHDRLGEGSFAIAARRGQGARARAAAADHDEGELALDRAPAELSGLRGGQAPGR